MGRIATHRQGISQCLESGHPETSWLELLLAKAFEFPRSHCGRYCVAVDNAASSDILWCQV